MTRVFRAMCKEEAEGVNDHPPIVWRTRYKWFGTEDFVKNRVLDGKFNNSKYVNKYSVLCEYEIISGIEHFTKCGYREMMLDRRNANNVNLKLISKGTINEYIP